MGTPRTILYADIVPAGGNGVIDLDDVLCALAGFAAAAACPAADLAPCEGNGIIDLDDVLAVLATFAGTPPCPDPCP